MAATNKTPILLYGSTTATNQPSAGNLTNSSDGCEIAINVADKNLFFKDSTNVVNTVPIRQSSASSNGWLSSTDWNTFNNKQPAGTYVTSVTGTSPVVSSGGTTPAISLASGYGDTQNPYTSKTAKYFLAAPNASSGAPTFRAIVASDIPTLNQDTTGTATYASNLTSNAGLQTPFTYGGLNYGLALGSVFSGTTYTTGYLNNLLGEAQLALGGYYYGSGLYTAAGTGYGAICPGLGYVDVRAATGLTAGTTFTPTQVARFFASGGVSIGNTTDPGAANLSVSGNVVMSTSGKGIDFSATAGTGTSELLADYEEGTWTANLTASITGPTTPVTTTGTYTKVGRQVTVTCSFLAVSLSGSSGDVQITGLPYVVGSQDCHGTCGNNSLSGSSLMCTAVSGASLLAIRSLDTTVYTPTVSGTVYVLATVTYFV